MRAGNRLGLGRLPDAFHGAAGAGPHDHAYWLPEDQDGDGRIDHVLLHARAGFSRALLPALAAAGPVWLGRELEWSLLPVWMGRLAPGGLLGPARRWETVTAYVTPLWRTGRQGRERPGLDPTSQLRREIALRGLAPPAGLWWRGETAFETATKTRRAPHDAWQGALILLFPEPVAGPLAFGFGAHFGLGLLRPSDYPSRP